MITTNHPENGSKRPLVRLYSKNKLDSFKHELTCDTTWEKLYQLPGDSVNELCEEFMSNLKTPHGIHFPLKMTSRKRAKDKKWATRGIKHSSLSKNKLYKNISECLMQEIKKHSKDIFLFLKKFIWQPKKHIIRIKFKNSVENLWKTFSPMINPSKRNRTEKSRNFLLIIIQSQKVLKLQIPLRTISVKLVNL